MMPSASKIHEVSCSLSLELSLSLLSGRFLISSFYVMEAVCLNRDTQTFCAWQASVRTSKSLL